MIAAASAAAQPAASTNKVQPSSKKKVNVRELENREKAAPPAKQQKKVENKAEAKIPSAMPVPPDAKGKTFQPSADAQKKNLGATSGKPKTKGTPIEPLFPALGDDGFSIPPDCGGAVGPNHVMTTLNSQVRIQTRTGVTISTVTLDGFFGTTGTFDPKVLYDRFNDRWIMTAPKDGQSTTSALQLAVSDSGDPTGTWSIYTFDPDATNVKWFDYPSIGFNKNWIVITGNLFRVSDNAFQSSQVYMFDKAATYGGTAVPTVSNRPFAEGGATCPAITQDNTQTTEYLVSTWNTNSGGNGYLRIFTITGTPAAPVYTMTALMPSVASTWNFLPNPAQADFAPQATVTQKIQNNDSRIHDVVYQNGSLWCASAGFLPAATPTHSAAQWWQIDPTTGNVTQFGRVEDTTAANFFAFPTIGVNTYNDVLLGYSSFSATQFASANYSFRLNADATSTLQPTVQFRAGLAKYYKDFGTGQNRWGDYSTTVVDPDGFSLWTLQEYAAMPSGGSDRWGTEWTRVVPPVPSLYVQDRTDDVGAEPNASGQPMYESTDIWLRKLQDAAHAFAHVTDNAEYRTGTANPNYVYVEVRNRGGAPSSGTETLTVYWAKASSGLSWQSPWTGGVYFDPGPNTMLMGDVVGSTTVTAIPAGGNTIFEFPWNPPNPATYAGAFGADQNHFCLLARVTSGTTMPFGMTFPETSDLYANVQNNNKVAWKNIEVYDSLPGTGAPAHAVIANLGTGAMKAAIRFAVLNADGEPFAFDTGTLHVTPGQKLKDLLRGAPITGDGIKDRGDGTFDVIQKDATIRNIALAPNEFATLDIAFVPNNPSQKLEGLAVRITQLADVGGADRIIGGQTLVFGKVKGFNEKQPAGGAVSPSPQPNPQPQAHWPWYWWLILVLIILAIIAVILIRR